MRPIAVSTLPPAPSMHGVQVLGWCLDNVERVTDDLEIIHQAAAQLKAQRDERVLETWLNALRAATTPADVLAAFAPDVARAGGSGPARGTGGL